MKNILLIAIVILTLSSCGEKPAATSTKNILTDIITVTDNGTAYADTVMIDPGARGMVGAGHPDTYNDSVMRGQVIPKQGASAADKKAASADSLNNEVQSMMFQCTIHKAADKSLFTLKYFSPAPAFPVSISIINAVGPANGIGIYKATTNIADTAKTTDMAIGNYGSVFTETFSGGQKYTVDSVMVNITKAYGHTVMGDYQLWLSNPAGHKTVTGAINWNTASIN